VLRAGVMGAAILATSATLRPRSVRAAEVTSASAPPGAYTLNEGWLFGGAYVSGAEAPGFSEAGFAAVTLPHTVTPLSWGDWDHTRWEQVWVYRKHLAQSPAAGQRVFVDFDGVMTNATLYVNGTQVAQHQGGYLPWSAELTQHLTSSDNVLAVVVDGRWLDVPPSGSSNGAISVDYLQPAGIYRDAGLRIVPGVFVSDVFAQPANVLSSSPSVNLAVTIDTGSVTSGALTLSARLLDGSTVVAQTSGTASATSQGTTTANLQLTGLSGIQLWSPEHPKLYTVSVTVTSGSASHTTQVRTGFRTAQFTTQGFVLNGARYEIFGINRHQLFPYTGMAAPERLQRRDAELVRNELNCNMVRCSHYPQSPHFLDACDELGLMVWEEPPGWQYMGDTAFQQIVVQNVHDMVVRDRNRPSVIVWATRLNETASYPTLYAQTHQLAKQLDPSRQTTGAMNTQSQSGWAEDVYAYDDYHHDSNGNAILEPPLTSVPYLVSEAVGALDGAPLYRWIDTEQTLAIQARMHAQVHDIAQGNQAYCGLLGWAGIDYASLSGGNRIWHSVKWPGVIDTFRVPKPGAAFYQSQVDPAARVVIRPVFFWDFGSSGDSGGPGAQAMIATNCDKLEVYVGGQHLTTGTPDTQNFPHLAHPPVTVDLSSVDASSKPDLRIDGYVAGQDQPAGSLQMSSDPSADVLSLVIQDSVITGDGTDATRFTIRALDAHGNQRPYVTGDVALALSGPATLVADNPFPFAEFGGVGGGFIRSNAGQTGTATLTATHPVLGTRSAQVTVQAQPAAVGAAPGGDAPGGSAPGAPRRGARAALPAIPRPEVSGRSRGRRSAPRSAPSSPPTVSARGSAALFVTLATRSPSPPRPPARS
jgi:beta-galactosidase